MSKIRLAMIGCGGNSSGHARRMNANPDVQIVAGCDVNTDIVDAYIDRNVPDLEPRPKSYDDLDKLFQGQRGAITVSYLNRLVNVYHGR